VRTHEVAEAEARISKVVLVPPEAAREVRDALLHLALVKYQEGEERRDAVLREYSVNIRDAYWRAATIAEKRAGTAEARPTVMDIMHVLSGDGGMMPIERDVRAILRILGLSISEP
jgi:hypothetical protein